MFHRSLILTLSLLAGCTSSTKPETISVGDDIVIATQTLVAWGGVGHHMDIYTVPVGDVDGSPDSDPDHYKVVDPATIPFHAYSFGDRGISLHHRDGVVIDIEMITYGDSKLTTKYQTGITAIARSDFE